MGAVDIWSIENQENKWQGNTLVEEMKKFWLKILGVSEVKVRGYGEKAISDIRCVFWEVKEGRSRAGGVKGF